MLKSYCIHGDHGLETERAQEQAAEEGLLSSLNLSLPLAQVKRKADLIRFRIKYCKESPQLHVKVFGS